MKNQNKTSIPKEMLPLLLKKYANCSSFIIEIEITTDLSSSSVYKVKYILIIIVAFK
jgi:hypothetical protein